MEIELSKHGIAPNSKNRAVPSSAMDTKNLPSLPFVTMSILSIHHRGVG